MHAAKGILTTRGGMTSHAAVVARGMGRPCVAGAGGIAVDYASQTLSAGGLVVRAGETITHRRQRRARCSQARLR
jgi:pyruvate,orthophosphate dikinase